MPATSGQGSALHRFAPLFEYPGPDLAGQVSRALAGLPEDAATHLERFATYVAANTTGEIEDLYTRTFDLVPRCPPYVGYQLYGDTYRRGEVMARLAGLSSECGLDIASGELPDHLSVALRVLALAPPGKVEELASEVVLPALERMQSVLSESGNPFADLVAAVRAAAGEAFTARPGREARE